jgi:hypothetical protein
MKADVKFRLENSCNCCRWWQQPRGNDPVYINSLGRVEPWDADKARDLAMSVRRAMANLTTSVADWARGSGVPMGPVLDRAREVTRIDLDRGVPISKKELDSIERVVSETILSLSLDASSESTPTSDGAEASTSSPRDVNLKC